MDLGGSVCESEQENEQDCLLTDRSAKTYTIESNEKCFGAKTKINSKVSTAGDSIVTSRDQTRFASALKQSAKEVASMRGIKIPALCPCSPSFWNFNAEKCAINCQFYMNPKLYDRIAQSILKSFDINARW